MKNFVWLAFAATCAAAASGAQEWPVLWRIGTVDGAGNEFAHAPGGFKDYADDATLVVGETAAVRDWPYCHPGPMDGWAGSRTHQHVVFFGASGDVSGPCRLRVALVDSHPAAPPVLRLDLNGHAVEYQTPHGAADASIMGDPKKGQRHEFMVDFPAGALKEGLNTLLIANIRGSWLVYDALALETASNGVAVADADGPTEIIGCSSLPFLTERDGKLYQTANVAVRHIRKPAKAELAVGDGPAVSAALECGVQNVEVTFPAVDAPATLPVRLTVAKQESRETTLEVTPVRRWTIYLLPHSHVDIGYTHLQSDVERLQCEHLENAMVLAQKSADYPEGARFKWNAEVLWPVDCYLRVTTPEKRMAFFESVRQGHIGLDALYGNQLTALCRPEELVRLLEYARRLQRDNDIAVESAMISDVPGYTWGLIPVLADSGVRYFSIGPNVGHRIGYTLTDWGDKAFYWQSPAGDSKVMCWMAGTAYSFFHRGPLRDMQPVLEYLTQLERSDYPYDLVQMRYSIGGDNGPPDPGLSDFVKEWNATHAYPRIVIATTMDMFAAFDAKYGETLETVTGDFTPYWEDGAGSSAAETAMNRASAERLTQAETLTAMLCPERYRPEAFSEAWRGVLLYDEHTWGAHNSITEPDSDFVKGQWAAKRQFAVDGDTQSRQLMDAVVDAVEADGETVESVLVFNTSSWDRTGLVTIPADWKLAGDRVRGTWRGVPSQRLRTGELVFLATEIPALGSRRYTFRPGEASSRGGVAAAEGNRLRNGELELVIDPETGGIASLKSLEDGRELVKEGQRLNEYIYVNGRDPKSRAVSGPATVTVVENGPLVASLRIAGPAPGCRELVRELRVVAGLPYVEIVNTLDKEDIRDREAVHFAFPLEVPEGTVRMDTPWAVVRPDDDQLSGACRNYFTVQRWVDASNHAFGVTLSPVDAPLVQVADIQNDPRVVGWLRELPPSTDLYSYAMNNYWETNYKASQGGVTRFRYVLALHDGFDAAEAARFGAECSQPLLPVKAEADVAAPRLPLQVRSKGVVATAIKPCDDGDGHVVRLFGASGEPERVGLAWKNGNARFWRSNLGEERLEPLPDGAVDVPAYGMVTVRVKEELAP